MDFFIVLSKIPILFHFSLQFFLNFLSITTKKKEIQNYSRIARLIKIQRPPINQPPKMKIVKFVYNLRVHQLGETFVVVGFFFIESARTGIKKKRGEEGEGEK